MTNQHPADCVYCAKGWTPEHHSYVDPATQARSIAAARSFNERVRAAKAAR
jgi:hypothetical protein